MVDACHRCRKSRAKAEGRFHEFCFLTNEWGATGQDFSVWNITFDNYFTQELSVYMDGSFFWYRFID